MLRSKDMWEGLNFQSSKKQIGIGDGIKMEILCDQPR